MGRKRVGGACSLAVTLALSPMEHNAPSLPDTSEELS